MGFRDLVRKKDVALVLQEETGRCGGSAPGLRRDLNTADLVAFGIALIVGAGIFSTIGNAAYWGGPAVIFLYIFMAMACTCTALCYADFASRLPVAGSAYTYSYVAFGEVVAWVIGWTLIMEYTIAASAVSISWSDYFTGLIAGYGIHLPDHLSMDYFTASKSAKRIVDLLSRGYVPGSIEKMPGMGPVLAGFRAYNDAPRFFGMPLIFDLPALCIVFLITTLSYIGIRESKRITNGIVVIKIATILLVIIAGAFYIRPENWSPFAPNGVTGVLKGASAVFFAYLGFDAISNTAEECKHPQRDLPRGIIYSLLVCTLLYVALALVLTGVVHHGNLRVGDPLVAAFSGDGANLGFVSGIVAASAVVTMATVVLALIISQPRVLMSMGRDGLLPAVFSSIHPRFRTPWFSTVVTGIIVALPTQFMSLSSVTDLTSIGTLFAFILVCGGVLVLDGRQDVPHGKFKVPRVNSRYIFTPGILVIGTALCLAYPDYMKEWWNHTNSLAFLAITLFLAVASIVKGLSLIPLAGVEICLYLMTELGAVTWTGFTLWLCAGLACYLLYGRRHSKLNGKKGNIYNQGGF
ncbi:MAG: putative amino acid permease YhdG [Syntrophorhabdus sp. PtaB.Bin184]|nr:MAG: putative amino acid permease YhdG [Syntrophorhabdus sp. PtaB.Bin184]